MTTLAAPKFPDRATLAQWADWLVAAIAASLPWSTSVTAILVVVWIVVLAATLRWMDVRAEVLIWAGGFPVALVVLGVLGMLWADVSLVDRWKGLDSFLKLLVIPILFVQFRRSDRGLCVFGGYLTACVILLVASWAIFEWPGLWWKTQHLGAPVKSGPTQSGEFVTCIAVLFYLVLDFFKHGRRTLALGALILAFAMLANIVFVATSRTALVVLPVLVLIWGFRELRARSRIVLACAIAAVCGVAWVSSPYFRERTTQLWTDYERYEDANALNSSAERIEFWRKSVAFVRDAPLIGHGTGSIHSLFVGSSVGQQGAAASATTNPHNQTFAVAIQLGLLGAAVLWAMWIAHFLLFRGPGLAAWIGLVVVVQNIIGSLFNSHLFDFTQGWVYVFGVGVAGGMVLKNRNVAASARSS